MVTPSKVTLSEETPQQAVTFSNPTNAEVTVSMDSAVKGITSEVATNRQSVTFKLTDAENAIPGNATITVGAQKATVEIELTMAGGGSLGM